MNVDIIIVVYDDDVKVFVFFYFAAAQSHIYVSQQQSEEKSFVAAGNRGRECERERESKVFELKNLKGRAKSSRFCFICTTFLKRKKLFSCFLD
jgi:hypothetical protein